MKKKIITFIVLIMTLFIVSPNKVDAFSISNDTHPFYILDDKITSTEDLESWMDEYNQEQTCSGGDSILGDPNDENSVAWLLQQVLNIIKIVGPILVVILSSIDFAKVIVKSDDEAMAKAQKKLGMRLILAASLFFIPTIVEALLDVFGFTSSATCGIK